MKVAFYGGSFNPPHIGHVLAAAYLLGAGGFDRVLVVPVFGHAFDKELLDYTERVELCELAFANLKHVEISTIEASLPRPSYTVTTIEALQLQHPDWEWSLAVGADVLQEISRWHRSDELLRRVPLFVMGRHGYDNPEGHEALLPRVSSSEVRQWLRESQMTRLSQVVPRAVLTRIVQRGLYQ